jgi:hypothetical protein
MTADLKRAVALAKRVQHCVVALVGGDEAPYITSAGRLEPIAENQLAIEEWICPVTVSHLSAHPKIAILVWDPVDRNGYEILGEALMFEDRAFLNGYSSDAQAASYVPQVRRRVVVRVDRISGFDRGLRCSDIPQHAAPAAGLQIEGATEETRAGKTVPVCSFAPEWAEHARFEREDEPCDDGCAGLTAGKRL